MIGLEDFCEHASALNRLQEFSKLFLQDSLNSEFAYLFGLKDVYSGSGDNKKIVGYRAFIEHN